MISWHNARVVAGVFFLALLTACATPQSTALRGSMPEDIPTQFELDQVVFYPQEEHQCGPTSLAMVLQYAGRNIAPEQLQPLLYLPEKQGSLQVEMISTARRFGMLSYQLQPELHDVLREVSAGNPVLVLQNLGLSWYPVWHYAVVIGYDVTRGEMILRSGIERRQVLPFFTFENTWARSRYWAVVVSSPGTIPATANPERYIQSVLALAHTRPDSDIWLTYQAAVTRWPDSLVAKMAAGNFAFQQHQLEQALALFLQATQQHPDSVAAFNNLAQTLSDLGKYEDALSAAQHAVALGGALNVQARETLTEIEQRITASANK